MKNTFLVFVKRFKNCCELEKTKYKFGSVFKRRNIIFSNDQLQEKTLPVIIRIMLYYIPKL